MEDKDLKQEPDNRPEEAIEPESASDAVPAETPRRVRRPNPPRHAAKP